MRKGKLLSRFILFLSLSFASNFIFSENFESASDVEQTRLQISKLPEDDIWWNLYGQDMAWNNRNLHRFLPTVNVYRQGQVSQLEYNLSDEIASFPVDTPSGEKNIPAISE